MGKKFSTGLILIILVFLIKGILLILTIPPWEAPDEPGHVSYVHYLYNHKSIPSSMKPFVLSSISNSIKTDRKIFESAKKDKLKIPNNLELFDRNSLNLDPPILNNLASHPPLYYIYLIPFYKLSLFLPSYWSLLLLRFGSLILGSVSLILIFLISQKLFSAKNFSYLVVFLISFQPMFSFISAIVNIDVMVVFAFLLFLYFAIGLLKSKGIPKNFFIYISVVAGFAPLIKPQLIMLITLYILIIFIKWKAINPKFLFVNLFVFLPSALWFLYKKSTEGLSFLSYAVQNINESTIPIWRYPVEFLIAKQPIGIFMSFWGFFGWLDVPMPEWSYVLFLIVISISLLGYCLKRKQIKIVILKNKITTYFLIATFLLYILSIFAFDIQNFRLAHHFAIQGRYLAPILPLLIIFLIQGLFLYPKKIKNIIIILTIAIFVLNQVFAFVVVNHHYYGSTFIPKFLLMSIYRF